MLPEPVSYLVHRNGLRPVVPEGKSYAYVLAGNGLFKLAANRYLEALIPLARRRIAGLPPLEPYVRPRAGRIAGHLLWRILEDARRQSWDKPCEAMYHLVVDGGVIRALRPGQRATGGSLAYAGGGATEIVADVHSHHEMGAFFSGTDDRDEQGFRFYGVMGKIFTAPELALRVGMYGDFHRVPVTTLFTDAGPFRETRRK